MQKSSSYPLIVNKSNYISKGIYEYRLNQNIDLTNIKIALGNASMFFSWPNITADKNNNKFEIIHPDGLLTNATLSLTIPDGGYEISDINNYLRWFLIQNGYYIYNTSTLDETVYCEFRLNASTYSLEFISYPLPTTLPTGFSAGSALSTLPSTTRAPQLTVLDNNFKDVIGFDDDTYPSTQQTVLTTSSSTTIPVLSDVQNVIINLDCITNKFAANSQIVHSFSPAGVSYGHLITSEPNELCFVNCMSGYRDRIRISLTDQNLKPLNILDNEITIKLILQE